MAPAHDPATTPVLDPVPAPSAVEQCGGEQVISRLTAEGRVVHVGRMPARPAHHAPPARPLPDHVLQRLGGRPLWRHQAEAIDLARRGTDVVVATGTASGKSLCYQLPIAEAVADPIRPGSAIALFPTKALAHDQLGALHRLGFTDLVAGTYDGDATPEHKAWVRDTANVVLTNPEMLHAGILPRHARWQELLVRLRYVVVDELHVLRGVFGTHVAHLLRRLARVAHHYGAHPTFIFCSATIGHPERLASDLCGHPVTAVTDDGSPRGPRCLALLDPALLGEEQGARVSADSEAAAASAALIEAGHRTITFCRSRKGTELVAAEISRRLPDHLGRQVAAYRAGYLAQERRAIEDRLFGGELRGVVATSALELGVDVGGLDACVMNGFPGTIASLWQQAGRAGRHGDASVAVLVAGEDQLDRYLMLNPNEVFDRPPEPAVVNVTNPSIRDPHLACAAYELPLGYGDTRWWSAEELHDGIRNLVHADALRLRRRPRNGRREPVAHWCGTGFPAGEVGLRSGSRGEVRIVEERAGRLIGTVDESRAPASVHTGAIYLHRGQAWEVTGLDLDEGEATVREADGTYDTQARSSTQIEVIGVDTWRRVGAARLHLGTVEVVTEVTGYQRREARSRRILANEALDLPPQRLVTRAFWYTFAPDLPGAGGDRRRHDPGGSLHALEHAAIGMLPLFTICDRWDVGGVSTPHHAHTGAPSVFVYDAYPGGAGIAELGWEAGADHLAATLAVIDGCGCRAGCPSCVQSPKCGNGNEPLDKGGAAALLRAVLGH